MYSTSNPPQFAKNKSAEERKIAAEAANAVLEKGGTEEDAVFAAISQVKAYNRKKLQQVKAVEVPKKIPAHLAAILAKDVIEKADYEVIAESTSPKYLGIRKEFLGKNALPTNVQRNVVSAEFDENSRLVIYFDTGERIMTDSVHQVIENYISLTTQQGGDSPVQPSNIKHYDQNLTGTLVVIPFNIHKIHEIIAIYFTKAGKVVNVGWEHNTNQDIVIQSGVNLQGVHLVVHGK